MGGVRRRAEREGTADGFSSSSPCPGWRVGPTDAPDVALGGDRYGSGATFGFFGPRRYPCRSRRRATRPHPARLARHARATRSRVVRRRTRASALRRGTTGSSTPRIEGLRVSYTDAAHAVDASRHSTARRSRSPRRRAVLDQLILQAGVGSTALDTPDVLNAHADAVPGVATRRPAERATAPPSTTGDGHRFSSYVLPDRVRMRGARRHLRTVARRDRGRARDVDREPRARSRRCSAAHRDRRRLPRDRSRRADAPRSGRRARRSCSTASTSSPGATPEVLRDHDPAQPLAGRRSAVTPHRMSPPRFDVKGVPFTGAHRVSDDEKWCRPPVG